MSIDSFSEGLFNDLVRFGLVPVPTVSFEGFSNGARLLVDTGLPTPDVELQCPLPSGVHGGFLKWGYQIIYIY